MIDEGVNDVTFCACGARAMPGRDECHACAHGMPPDVEAERERLRLAALKAHDAIGTSPAVWRARRIAARRRRAALHAVR